MNIERLTTPWWALRVTLGAAAFLAGLDKFFNLLADWGGYLSPTIAGMLPLEPSSFMHLIGIIEMAVGGVILAGYTRLGGYVAAIWLCCIAVNLVATGHYFDVAVRDVAMAMSAFTLARLTEAGVGAEARDRAAAPNSLSSRAEVKLVSVILLGMAFVAVPSTAVLAQTNTGKAAVAVSSASALKQDLRKLWTDHVVWTRDYVVAAVGDQPDAAAAANRLMRNQEDIGKAIAAFYGAPAGEQLTTLLKQHIGIAVDLIKAAKAGDRAGQQQADAKWQQNAVDIADFLSKANPNWPKAALVDMMKMHLSTTTNEVVARLNKNWDEDVRSFDAVYDHILHMSDALAEGIVKQFPKRFSDGNTKSISQ